MNSHTSESFWKRFENLPEAIQTQARRAYQLFQADPRHPSLHFEKLRGYTDLWSVRISLQYRAVAVRADDNLIWFWIGTHNDFDRDFS